MTADLGLALSGGGSRAAAFHRGTLRGLLELGLVDRVGAISTVSGGSVFGAAWMAARARGERDEAFLTALRGVLERGFMRPALLHWRALKILAPGWSRTRRLAETFDEVLFPGVGLADLPAAPLLCLNTCVLNHAAVGRFSRGGFSCDGVGVRTAAGYPEVPLDGVSLGFATAASAAFPFGLPPLSLHRARLGNVAFTEALDGLVRLVLTDGGILENLGVQTLLRSTRFAAHHIVVSDAGLRDTTWRPGLLGRIKSAAIFGLSAQILDRLLVVMNDKQNRSMRQMVLRELVPGVAAPDPSRAVLFVRIAQDWTSIQRDADVSTIDLGRARALYDEMGGDRGVAAVNQVRTGFTALSGDTLDLLAAHARWQVHAIVALHGAALERRAAA